MLPSYFWSSASHEKRQHVGRQGGQARTRRGGKRTGWEGSGWVPRGEQPGVFVLSINYCCTFLDLVRATIPTSFPRLVSFKSVFDVVSVAGLTCVATSIPRGKPPPWRHRLQSVTKSTQLGYNTRCAGTSYYEASSCTRDYILKNSGPNRTNVIYGKKLSIDLHLRTSR